MHKRTDSSCFKSRKKHFVKETIRKCHFYWQDYEIFCSKLLCRYIFYFFSPF